MVNKLIAFTVLLAVSTLPAGCSRPSGTVTELNHYGVDSLDGLITTDGVELDRKVSSDGKGSLRIEAEAPRTVRLYETGDLDVENARLIYQARIRTEGIKGKAYLEMWCHFPGRGEFFSRDLATPLTGSIDWTTEETPFFLQAGENPDNVKLNLVVEGTGTVWIDAVRLLKGPLH